MTKLKNKTKLLVKTSKNFPLACYLLGPGSICWMIVLAMIPILINLNIESAYINYTQLNSNYTMGEGTVDNNSYVRLEFYEELREIHYHYTKNHKNFTGFSYLINSNLTVGDKVTLRINKTNPKISKIRNSSYSPDGWYIFIPIIVLLIFINNGVQNSKKSLDIKPKSLGYLEDSKVHIFSHFLIRRFSIVISSIIFCLLFDVGDIIAVFSFIYSFISENS
ncbi:MAG: hypothetical protein COB02_05415 [Candidatus Cloacimonadota bacterium]|nr:MAG: hypothetical protein COB02_05415 [Candidatus Cloacimonadota bacterium]